MIEINVKDFNALKTDEERLAYATEQVAFWRSVQRKLYRIAEAETVEEKAAIGAKLAAVAAPVAAETK